MSRERTAAPEHPASASAGYRPCRPGLAGGGGLLGDDEVAPPNERERERRARERDTGGDQEDARERAGEAAAVGVGQGAAPSRRERVAQRAHISRYQRRAKPSVAGFDDRAPGRALGQQRLGLAHNVVLEDRAQARDPGGDADLAKGVV